MAYRRGEEPERLFAGRPQTGTLLTRQPSREVTEEGSDTHV